MSCITLIKGSNTNDVLNRMLCIIQCHGSDVPSVPRGWCAGAGQRTHRPTWYNTISTSLCCLYDICQHTSTQSTSYSRASTPACRPLSWRPPALASTRSEARTHSIVMLTKTRSRVVTVTVSCTVPIVVVPYHPRSPRHPRRSGRSGLGRSPPGRSCCRLAPPRAPPRRCG